MYFRDTIQELPNIYTQLLNQPKHRYADLTQGKINSIFQTKEPVCGVYIMSDKDEPVYVGRSRHIAQRIGTDHRANTKTQATLAYKLSRLQEIVGITDILSARNYMYTHYTVQMIQVDNDYVRTLFEIYAAMELKTKYNSFRET